MQSWFSAAQESWDTVVSDSESRSTIWTFDKSRLVQLISRVVIEVKWASQFDRPRIRQRRAHHSPQAERYQMISEKRGQSKISIQDGRVVIHNTRQPIYINHRKRDKKTIER
jgi:hypothetical protein